MSNVIPKVVFAVLLLVIGFASGASTAAFRLQEEATLHCGAYFHPNDASFTWIKCAEGLE